MLVFHRRYSTSPACFPLSPPGFQVNSAGILVSGPLESISMEEYDKQMNINCRSVVCLSQLAVPHLVKTKGNIVNVSSITGMRSVRTESQIL